MDGSPNNLENLVDQMMFSLDMQSYLRNTEGFSALAEKMAPQEMDRLAALLSLGLSKGLAKILGNQIQDVGRQSQALQSSISKELVVAAEDFAVKDLEKKINVADFTARAQTELFKSVS